MKDIVAVVPVRAGSQRIKDKNSKPFAGSTLLDVKLETLKGVSNLKEIVVSSDCDHLLSIAKKHGVKTHRREAFYASSQCTNSDFFENLATVLDCDNVLYAPVTCPLISRDTFNFCIN